MEVTEGVPMERVLRDFAERAVGYAKAFRKEFDYSPESVADLEDILKYYHEDMAKSAPTQRQIHSMALVFGAYLGETILRNGGGAAGYAWGESKGRPILRKEGVWEIAPVGKIEKRLCEGPDESIQSFYDMSILIVEGRVSFPK